MKTTSTVMIGIGLVLVMVGACIDQMAACLTVIAFGIVCLVLGRLFAARAKNT